MDRYRVSNDGCAYLCTMRFTHWLPVFNAGGRVSQIVLDSLAFCRKEKGLILHAFVLMIDHLHLIARHEDLSGIIRSFKSWTSRRISDALKQDGRDQWLALMESRARIEGDSLTFKVWEEGFHPKRIESDAMFLQKLDYVHNNPVRKGFVSLPEHWRWSSAANYMKSGGTVTEIDPVDPLIV